MHVLQALDQFTVQLRADGRSPHTCRQYARHVHLLAEWLGATPIQRIDHETLAIFLSGPVATLRADGVPKKAASVNALRTSLRCFFVYLHEAGILQSNPARLIRRARCGAPPPRGLNEAEQKRLLNVLRREDGGRDHALFALMLATGVRVGSAVGLRVEDVDLEAGELWLRCAKNDRREKVILGPAIREHLRAYIGDRVDGPLFPGRHGRPIGVRHVNRRLKRWLRRAGITRAASAHALRHSFARGLYGKTGDIALVQKALTHRSIVSTLVYATATDGALREALGA